MSRIDQETRTARRARERAERDHNRRMRRLAIAALATLVDSDSTVSGMTMISPSGEVEYFDAGVMRRGGRA
jgi:hypothetical protein